MKEKTIFNLKIKELRREIIFNLVNTKSYRLKTIESKVFPIVLW